MNYIELQETTVEHKKKLDWEDICLRLEPKDIEEALQLFMYHQGGAYPITVATTIAEYFRAERWRLDSYRTFLETVALKAVQDKKLLQEDQDELPF